jgi:pimeloyl-ACP methyl ester carboxylesterase
MPRFTLIRTSLAAAALAFACHASAATSKLKLEPIVFKLADGTEVPAERGTFLVPEDRSDPRSRRISLGFVRFKSTNPRPGAPLVYLAGGPGGSGVAAAEGARQPLFLALRAAGDVIAFDQRGTGLSNHISPCTARRKLDPSLTLSDAALSSYYRETLEQCVRQWRAAGVAVNGYNTRENAEDIEELRRVLGARKVDLWGISYGTQLALAAMRQHPRSIGRVVLASADGLDQNVKLPAHVEAAFGRIERVMPRPGLVALMRAVHAKLDSNPQRFTFTPKGSGPLSFRIDSFPIRMMAGILPKNPDGIGPMAGAYLALQAGQTAPLAPQIYSYFYKAPLTMTGMAELMDIASGTTAARAQRVRAQLHGSLLGDAINFPVSRLMGRVPGLDVGDVFRKEVRSSIPVLLFSGDLDVRTPLGEQAEQPPG